MQQTHAGLAWTDAEIEHLTQYATDGIPDAESANRLGRSLMAIKSKKRSLGLSKPHKLSTRDPKLLAEILKFKMAGWTLKAIADVYEVYLTQISNVLRKNGFFYFCVNRKSYDYRYWSDIETHQLRKYLKRGYDLDRICTYFPNRTRKAVQGKIEHITRYYGTPEERQKRKAFEKRAKEKQLRVY